MIKHIWKSTFTLLLLASCSKEVDYGGIEMPSSPLLSIDSHWGVIKSAYLKIFAEPDKDSDVVTRLRPGYVVEVLSTTAKKEVIDERKAPWHKIRYNETVGWAFGAHLDIYNTEAKAVQAAKEKR